jgi:plastocyanin
MLNTARASLLALAVLTPAIAGCGSGSGSGGQATAKVGAGSQGAGGTEKVVIQSLTFEPGVLHADVGERVIWINKDNARHNITYKSGPKFTSSRPIVSPSTTFSIKLTHAGIIRYYCSIHPWMKATIVVAPG